MWHKPDTACCLALARSQPAPLWSRPRRGAHRPRADPSGRGAQVQAGQLPATEAGTDEKLLELFCAAQPMLCNVRYSVCLSL